eukprot:4504456-Amphidinium_carterae.1
MWRALEKLGTFDKDCYPHQGCIHSTARNTTSTGRSSSCAIACFNTPKRRQAPLWPMHLHLTALTSTGAASPSIAPSV